MDRFLEGKTALVTGASRGLGRAVAEAYAALGAVVAINYASNDSAARDTLEAIESKGGNAFLIKSAQGSYEAAEELTAELDAGLQDRTGSTALDILVNNAGGGPVHTIDTTTPELFEKVLGDNLRGPFYVTKLLTSRMREGGSVIFLSSLGARAALPQYVVYAMSKRAIETLTVIMAKELGPRNINVNCISPGIIASDANAEIRADDKLSATFAETTALKRLGVPSDLSGVAVSLVSPQMSYVTGQIIEVSGGMWL
jgi:NAD(P)-dependent dehydrogenase (short-subunit alcohol dehydrogenase family)